MEGIAETETKKPDDEGENIEDEYDEDNEEFYFESDHLALRGNADYRSVLRTIVILEAQRTEATKHIDLITEAEKIALNDPEAFLERLTAGESLDLPGRINIQSLPKIKFEKYNVPMPSIESKDESGNSNAKDAASNNDLTVRGRTFDQSKPETFNQLWTCEEQRRLEELLIEYPPEPVEMRRFAKIARALGNRTVRQVASRLQKYFQKLHAAGLPVPGRIPRSVRSYTSTRKHRSIKQHLIRPTTFFPSNFVPVNITDDDDASVSALDPNFYRNGCENSIEGENNESAKEDDSGDTVVVVDEASDTETSACTTDEMKIVQLVKRVKRDKEKKYPIEVSMSDHNGYTCDFCNEEPIVGTRWHCTTCKHSSIDFCSDCLIAQLQTDAPHSLDHKFIGVRISTEFRTQSDDESDADEDKDKDDMEASGSNEESQGNVFDKDYMSKKILQVENYLDPNFLPQ